MKARKAQLISADEAAKLLTKADGEPISHRRVLQLIEAGRLPAMLVGGVYVIDVQDLTSVMTRKVGRPPKPPKKQRRKGRD